MLVYFRSNVLVLYSMKFYAVDRLFRNVTQVKVVIVYKNITHVKIKSLVE